MRRWVCGPRLALGLTFNGFRVSSQPVGSWPETLVLYRMRPGLDARGLSFVIGGAADTAV